MAENHRFETPFDIPLTSKIRGYRYLTCQGAGIKAVGLLGALELLESIGVISQLEAIAGCSLSAIFATLVALGYSTKEIREALNALDFRRLSNKYDNEAIEWANDARKTFSMVPTQKNRKQALMQLPIVQQRYQKVEKIAEAFQYSKAAIGMAFERKMGLWKQDALLTMIQRLIARKTGKLNLTFKELSVLAKAQPGSFHNLILTGSNMLTEEHEYYDARAWPDLPIIEALRISLSFPAGFLPVIKPLLKRKRRLKGEDEYRLGVRLDGGLLENLPEIFHHAPYFHPSEEAPTNPEVLTLAFVEDKAPSPQETADSFLHIFYKTSLLEKKLKKKYADTIIYIASESLGPLDFEKEKQNREKLFKLGWEAAYQSVSTILLAEIQDAKKYQEMSLDKLLRYKACVVYDSKNSNAKQMLELNEHINKAAKRLRISPAELAVKEKFESLKLERLANILGEDSSLSQSQMMSHREKNRLVSAHRKLEELKNLSIEQNLQMNELSLLLSGLELRKLEFLEKYHHPSHNEWREHLESHLSVITDFRCRENQYKTKLSGLESEHEAIKNKYEKNMIIEAQFKVAKVRIAVQTKYIKNMLADLKMEREKFIKSGIIAYYKAKHDIFLCHFFEELNEEFDTPLDALAEETQKTDRFPKKFNDMIAFIEQQKAICKVHLKEARLIKKVTAKELKGLKNEWTALNKGFTKTEKHSETFACDSGELKHKMKNLEDKLNKSLHEKTIFIAKINQYFLSDRPLLKKHCIKAVLNLHKYTVG